MMENSTTHSSTAAYVRTGLIFMQSFHGWFYLCNSTSLTRLPNLLGMEEVTPQSIVLCYIIKCNHKNAVSCTSTIQSDLELLPL